MSPTEAAKLLEVPAGATPDQLEARFLDLRRKLEDKIAKAPTPGLQAKYRESLAAVTTAFETLALAADGSALPVVRKSVAGGAAPGPGATPPSPGSPPPAAINRPTAAKKSSKEFFVVALIAVAVLGAGGWFILKTRAEKAEQVRLAAQTAAAEQAAASAELQRQAAARLKADQEKALAEAAAKDEQSRRDKVLTTARVQLAEARIVWGAFEAETRRAERDATEARAERRALRNPSAEDSAHATATEAAASAYAEWAGAQLAAHPARRALVRLEELINARDASATETELAELPRALRQLEQDIAEAQRTLRSITGSLHINASPGIFTWEVRDAFGRTQRGQTPATVNDLGIGPATVRLTREGWPLFEEKVPITRGATPTYFVERPVGRLELKSESPGVNFVVVDSLGRRFTGAVPARLDEIAAGGAKVTFTADNGWPLANPAVTIVAGQSATVTAPVALASGTITANVANAVVFENSRELGPVPLALKNRPLGHAVFEVRAPGHHSAQLTAILKPGENSLPAAILEPVTERDIVRELVSPYRGQWVSGMKFSFTISDDGLFLTHPEPGHYFNTAGPQEIRLIDEKRRLIAVPHAWGTVWLVLRLADERIEYLRTTATLTQDEWRLGYTQGLSAKWVPVSEAHTLLADKTPYAVYKRAP